MAGFRALCVLRYRSLHCRRQSRSHAGGGGPDCVSPRLTETEEIAVSRPSPLFPAGKTVKVDGRQGATSHPADAMMDDLINL